MEMRDIFMNIITLIYYSNLVIQKVHLPRNLHRSPQIGTSLYFRTAMTSKKAKERFVTCPNRAFRKPFRRDIVTEATTRASTSHKDGRSGRAFKLLSGCSRPAGNTDKV
jgi:hypothetical protein